MKHSLVTGSPIPGGAWMLVPIVLLGVILQASAAPLVEVRGVRPDWLLLMAVYLGLRVPRGQAVTGAWAMGFLAELLTIERLGLMSVPYVLTAWSVGAIRDAVTRGSLLTECMVTLVAGLLTFGMWLVYRCVLYGPPTAWATALWSDWIARAIYPAVWVWPLHSLLWLTSLVLALPPAPKPARR